MKEDPWDDPGAQDWLAYVHDHVLPMVDQSNVCISLCPSNGKVDIKFAVELGMMVMLDKPIIVVAAADDDIPAKLLAVSNKVVVADIGTPQGRSKFMSALQEFNDGL